MPLNQLPLGPPNETPGLVSQSSSRPADVLLMNWSNGRPATLDVHVMGLSSLSPYQKLHSPKVTLFKSEFSASLLRTSPIFALVVLTAFPLMLKPSAVWQKILLLVSKRSTDPFASALALTENLTPPATSLDKSVWPCGEAMP